MDVKETLQPVRMIIVFMVLVIALVSWALRLMQQALDQREFSLMLAGCLVSSAAAALVAVYFLMNSYVGYFATASDRISALQGGAHIDWISELELASDVDL
jgi:hypothetical protein